MVSITKDRPDEKCNSRLRLVANLLYSLRAKDQTLMHNSKDNLYGMLTVLIKLFNIGNRDSCTVNWSPKNT